MSVDAESAMRSPLMGTTFCSRGMQSRTIHGRPDHIHPPGNQSTGIMPSVDKIRRLLKLLERLQSGRVYNSKDLSELCDVSRRTIFRDLRLLQDSGLPLLYDEQRQGYWMTSASFLPPADLTLTETLALIVLARSLGRHDDGLPFYQAAREAGFKLFNNLPDHLQQEIGDLSELIEVQIDRRNPLDESHPVHQTLVQALSARRGVRIHYGSLFEKKQIRTLLSPYRLFFARRSWYTIGRSSLHRAVRTFHLGRILSADLTDDSYEIPPRFSLARYLGNAWHMIRERGRRTDVVIRFHPKVATNVAEVAWHKTQRIRWNDDRTMDFCVTVDGLQEIAWWILGYGNQAEVLEPNELRDMIAQHAADMLKAYRRSRRSHGSKPSRTPHRRSRPPA
ncbi:MAG: transcriptional regulator, partial [Planctomycetaceae bacterium]|nr:transcriptional regulator [Planctomycetaceae bacterium]